MLHLGWSHLWTTPWGDFAACNPANELVATIGQPYTGFLQQMLALTLVVILALAKTLVCILIVNASEQGEVVSSSP